MLLGLGVLVAVSAISEDHLSQSRESVGEISKRVEVLDNSAHGRARVN